MYRYHYDHYGILTQDPQIVSVEAESKVSIPVQDEFLIMSIATKQDEM
jgi:hypothetical protein